MLDWFTTIPGILVICGVVLLILAIVLFIMGNKREKKLAAAAPVSGVNNNQPLVSDGITTVSTDSVSTSEPVSSGLVLDNNDTITDDKVAENNGVVGVTYDFSTPESNSMLEEKPSEFDFSISTAPVVEESSVSVDQPEVTVYPTAEPVVEETATPASNFNFEVPAVEEAPVEPVVEAPTSAFSFDIPAPVATEEVVETKVEEEKIEEPTVEAYNPVNDFSFTTPVEEAPAEPVVEAPVEEVKTEEPTVEAYNPVNDFNFTTPVEETPVEPAVAPQESEVSTIDIPTIQE